MLSPRLDILPAPQRALWPELAEVPHSFVLYGGTAIALRLGHRSSVDFDFFSSEPLVPTALIEQVGWLAVAERLQSATNTLTVAVRRAGGPVKVSFFGGLHLGRVGEPEPTADGVAVASLLDLAATKVAVIQQRAERRDYLDVATLLDAGVSLARALGAAQALYLAQFNPMISLKALSYFADGDLPELPQSIRDRLAGEAAEVREIPAVARCSDRIR